VGEYGDIIFIYMYGKYNICGGMEAPDKYGNAFVVWIGKW
jgi:hypothetical protein